MPIHVVLLEMIIDPTCSIAFERQPEEADIMDIDRRKVNSAIVMKGVFCKALLWFCDIRSFFRLYLFLLPTEGAEHARTFFTVLVLANLLSYM